MKGLAFRAFELTRSFLSMWPEAYVKLSHFEKSSTLADGGANVNLVSNAIETMGIIVELKSSSWVVSNIGVIQKYIESWIKSANPKFASNLETLVRHVLRAIADSNSDGTAEVSPDVIAFNKFMELIIQAGLRDSTCLPITISLIDASSPIGETNYAMINDMVKTLQKLVKEIQTAYGTPAASTPKQAEMLHNCIKIIQILNSTTSAMADLRRSFLQSFGALIDLTDDSEILSALIKVCRQWVFDKSMAFPTIKEKASILVKMVTFETRGLDTLLDEFLQLIADIYKDSAFLGTELTVRLESAFLIGTSRKKNPTISALFGDILDQSIGRNPYARLMYILGIQNWEPLSENYWIAVGLDLCLRSFDLESTLAASFVDVNLPMGSTISESQKPAKRKDLEKAFDKNYLQFLQDMVTSTSASIVKPLQHLVQLDDSLAHVIWVQLFPLFWSLLSGRQRHDLTKVIIPLLSKEFHSKQTEARPNVIQTLLDGICDASPSMQLPPQLLKYLGKTFNSWHTCIELLKRPTYPIKSGSNAGAAREEDKIRDSSLDAITELYAAIGEEDMVYGLWRNRSMFLETNAALSFEQVGMWSQAQTMYESAQTKARSGILPFTESEYCLWESNWVKCAQRLQQWDILTDLSKSESDSNLMLECAWRLSDWQAERELLVSNVSQIQDNEIRKQIYESFLLLQSYNDGKCSVTEVQRACDEGVQSVMRQWVGLPKYVSEAHIPLLHNFQLFVEMTEACQIITNLQSTNAGNIDTKSQELKGILQVWRDRLPNEWDDINLWSDVVSWRQHVFSIVNKAYLPLIPHLSQPSGSVGSPTSSYAYRGYHETAWIINRFAHVCRKHQLTDVCVNALSKIYTLPNIEIQEAFFKLREQAKCHFQSSSEYSAGLDVINNTNLLYFTTSQKAEFFAMKGTFLSKLNLHDDSSQAFSSAVQMDMSLPKAWGSWGQYNDRMFKENPTETKYAASAVNCFLHAAGLYNNARSRKYIARILWLLSMDDSKLNIAKAYDLYKGDIPLWFWITFIPQLLVSLSSKEARFARQVLMKLAKAYPQVS